MKKTTKRILVISAIVIFIGLAVYLMYVMVEPLNYDALRKVRGTVIAIHNGNWRGVNGKIIFWEKALRVTKGGEWWRLEKGDIVRDRKWFVYPSDKFRVEPFHEIVLYYKLTENRHDPVVHVIKVEDLGIAEIKF